MTRKRYTPLLARNRRIHALRTASVGVRVEESGPRPLRGIVAIKIRFRDPLVPVGNTPTLLNHNDVIKYTNALFVARELKAFSFEGGWKLVFDRMLLEYDEDIIAEALRRCVAYSPAWFSHKYMMRVCAEVADEFKSR